MSKNICPIFIIGTERSGSNLLNSMLNSHSEIISPHPTHLIANFYHIQNLYNDLNIEKNLKRLIKDMIIQTWFRKWGIKYEPEKIIERLVEKSVVGITDVMYDLYAEKFGKKRWCNKSTININFNKPIKDYYNKVKFIYLYRDGRDVAVSYMKANWGHKHILMLAEMWREQQARGIHLSEERYSKDEIMQVKYEDLLLNSENVLKKLCVFLEINYEPNMMNYYENQYSKNISGRFDGLKLLTAPVKKDNFNKFKKELPEKDILIFESVAYSQLEHLGYELCFNKSEHMQFSEEYRKIAAAENEKLMRKTELKVLSEFLPRKLKMMHLKWIKFREEKLC